jgi:S1-C subfamily serine protease
VRLTHDHIFGPSAFAKKNIKGRIFLDTLELFLFPPVDDLPNAGDIYLQLDGVPVNYSDQLRTVLDEKFPNKWID